MDRNHIDLRVFGKSIRNSPRSLQPFSLLVVEGDATIEGGLKTLFPGCLVTSRACHRAAYKFFLENQVDLVILEHCHLNPCLELLQIMKSIRPSVPILVVTACGSEDFAVQAFRSGARDYFKKPLQIDEVELCIRAILGIRSPAPETPVRDPLQRAIGFIEKNLHTPLRLPHVAKEAGMSPSRFSRAFKKKTGVTYGDYMNHLRIAKAKEMLRSETVPMAEVVFACGFSSQIHFIRTFKKSTGVTPGTFRKAVRA